MARPWHESKVGGPSLQLPTIPSGATPRPILGEKGISSLAIAAIGPQVLVLSRAKRDGALGDLVAAFINWSFFELPGVHLDDIDVPVVTLPGGTMPGPTEIDSLLGSCLDSFSARVNARGVDVRDQCPTSSRSSPSQSIQLV